MQDRSEAEQGERYVEDSVGSSLHSKWMERSNAAREEDLRDLGYPCNLSKGKIKIATPFLTFSLLQGSKTR